MSSTVNHLLILIIAVAIASGCARKHKVTESEEQALFERVSDLGAEGFYDEAIALSDSILNSDIELSDTVKAYIMIERNVALMNAGKTTEAAAYADTLADFGDARHIAEAASNALQIKGVALRRDGKFDEAVEAYSHGLEISKESGDVEMEQQFYDLLAIVYAQNRRAEEAEKFAGKAIELARHMNDSNAVISSVSTLGGVLAADDRNKELISMLKSYAPYADGAVPLMKIKYLTPLLHAWIKLDSLPQAAEAIKEARAVTAVLPPEHPASISVESAAALLAGKEGEYMRQWKIYLHIDSIGMPGSLESETLHDRAICLNSLGRYKEAFDMERKAFDTLDAIRSSESQRQLSEFYVKYDTLQKELEIQKLHNQRMLWISIAIGLALLTAIFIITVVGARRRIRVRHELERNRDYLRGLEQERARMGRELHDNIAGRLLGMQFQLDTLSREETVSKLSEIGRDVRRLSHELMPPEFQYASLTQLLTDFMADFNSTHKQCRLILTDEGSFDWNSVDNSVAMELYRMVQEGVNNALRHANPTEIRIILDGNDKYELTIENDLNNVDIPVIGESDLKTLRVRAKVINSEIRTSSGSGFFSLHITQK